MKERELRSNYQEVSGRAKDKVLAQLDKHAIHFVNQSPFLVMATANKQGQLDNSPRGGKPGFVLVRDGKLLLPDAKGNNRLDSLVNITETGRVGLLFMIPGVDETLRVNGKASLSQDAALIGLFEERIPLKTVVVIETEEVFLHCAKAFMRSKLWDEESKIERSSFPSMGQMLKDQLKSPEPPESREDMLKRYQQDL